MRKRVELLDLWRTAAIVCMVVYHLLYDLYSFRVISPEAMFSPGLNIFERCIAGSFILLAGVSSRFSRSNIKRGLITLGCAMAVTLVSVLVGDPILFGVLHFLGCAMLLYGLLGKFFEKIPKYAAPILYLALFSAAYWVIYYKTQYTLVGVKFLFPLGLTAAGFYSADYFPLIPWFFLFLLGSWLGGILIELRKNREVRLLNVSVPPALTWPGRHSLLIYMLHQPVLYGAVWLIVSRG
ncbi:MAG: DUF1624 domain-containing protein [Firmicutes bacterium]|nr:DUF1624 domain-containing protein [Bacillota bacterium]